MNEETRVFAFPGKAAQPDWATATWLVPLMVNAELALVIVESWLLGRAFPAIPAAASVGASVFVLLVVVPAFLAAQGLGLV